MGGSCFPLESFEVKLAWGGGLRRKAGKEEVRIYRSGQASSWCSQELDSMLQACSCSCW